MCVFTNLYNMKKVEKIIKIIDKRVLEKVFADQQDELEDRRDRNLCHRKEENLIEVSSPQAQVVIGVRRSGKSTLCFQALENAKVQYAYADFDDERLANMGGEQLNDVLEVMYKIYGDFKYLLLDEVQDIDGWHLFVNRLLRKGIHVIVTGSNANLLSSELATYLTGRNKEIDLFPFSFAEYCTMKGVDTVKHTTKAEAFRRSAFDDYLKDGGFPEKFFISDTSKYVEGLVRNILVRDIEERYDIAYKDAFEKMAHHLLNISPTVIDAPNLAQLFDIKSNTTVRNYLKYLKDAFLLIEVQKYSQKSKQRVILEKVYPVDVALMNERENAFAGDNLGWRLETLVLIELKRRSKILNQDVYYLKDRAAECDFLVCKGNSVLQAIQVSYDISAPKTRKREINGLLFAAKKTKCKNLLLLTDHEYEDITVGELEIKVRPVYEWAAESQS